MPAASLQLTRGKILLVGALLVIKSEEEAVEVEATELTLLAYHHLRRVGSAVNDFLDSWLVFIVLDIVKTLLDHLRTPDLHVLPVLK